MIAIPEPCAGSRFCQAIAGGIGFSVPQSIAATILQVWSRSAVAYLDGEETTNAFETLCSSGTRSTGSHPRTWFEDWTA